MKCAVCVYSSYYSSPSPWVEMRLRPMEDQQINMPITLHSARFRYVLLRAHPASLQTFYTPYAYRITLCIYRHVLYYRRRMSIMSLSTTMNT
jgi:hypothetical protein